jgi:ankyrin repeat protein
MPHRRFLNACYRGNIFTIKRYLFLHRNFDINCLNEEGKTALYIACEQGHFHLVKLFLEPSTFEQRYLLRQTVNIDALSSDSSRESDFPKWTALDAACNKRHFDIILFLLQRCDNEINYANNLALAYIDQDIDLIRILLMPRENLNLLSKVLYSSVLSFGYEDRALTHYPMMTRYLLSENYFPFAIACSQNDLDLVKILLLRIYHAQKNNTLSADKNILLSSIIQKEFYYGFHVAVRFSHNDIAVLIYNQILFKDGIFSNEQFDTTTGNHSAIILPFIYKNIFLFIKIMLAKKTVLQDLDLKAMATQYDDSLEHRAILKLLLQSALLDNEKANTIFLWACIENNSELVQYLISDESPYSCDLNQIIKFKNVLIDSKIFQDTPLLYAIQRNYVTLAKVLLSDPSIDINIGILINDDTIDSKPIYLATKAGQAEIIPLLFEERHRLRVDHDTKLKIFNAAMHARKNRLETINLLIHYFNFSMEDLEWAIFKACTNHNLDALELLLSHSKMDIDKISNGKLKQQLLYAYKEKANIMIIAYKLAFQNINPGTLTPAAIYTFLGIANPIASEKKFFEDNCEAIKDCIKQAYEKLLSPGIIFALVILFSDNFLQLRKTPEQLPAYSMQQWPKACNFFKSTSKLPLELQMNVVNKLCRKTATFVSVTETEKGLRGNISAFGGR